MYDRTPYTSPDAFDNVGTQLLTARRPVVLEESHILSPTFANSARLGFNRRGPSALRVVYAEHDPKRNYVRQWNFSIQQEVTPSLTAMIGYVGSRGVHQPFCVDDADLVIPVPFTPTWGTVADPSGTNSSDDYTFPGRLTGPGADRLLTPEP